ncbi:MAG: hypothetical protein ACLR23_19885 [Clostridia bacterium]
MSWKPLTIRKAGPPSTEVTGYTQKDYIPPIWRFGETTARYLRIRFTGSNAEALSLAEVEIYHDDGTVPCRRRSPPSPAVWMSPPMFQGDSNGSLTTRRWKHPPIILSIPTISMTGRRNG